MKKIKVKCPAKINLDLRVFKKDKITGYHPIKSIMQTISLFDFLTIAISKGSGINLSGDNKEIPYDETNLCHKAAKLFLNEINDDYKIDIEIEKNIPVCAGLAGGSADGAGVLYGLNKLLNEPLDRILLHSIAFKLGSDLNFCLEGGTKLCTNRGEKMVSMPFYDFKLSLVKPKNLKIAAKEAYSAFDELKTASNMKNDLEYALLDKYEELRFLHSKNMQMSGSGPVYFLKDKNVDFELDKDKYIVYNNLNSIPHGTIEA